MNVFAAIESAVNSACLAALANATATLGGASVSGVFDAAYQEQFGIAGSSPSFLCAAADVSAVAEGTAATINGVAYTVAGIEPDGTGLTRLRLQEA